MTTKRMFSKKITNTDAFLDMPLSSQVLYFHLNMEADDDGFVASPKKIMRMIGCQDDDYKILIAKRFLITFKNEVCIIKHWLIHNLIRADLYKETNYKKEKAQLGLNENGAYTELREGISEIKKIEEPEWLKVRRGTKRTVIGTKSALRLDKDRLDKIRIDKNRESSRNFVPPALEEIKNYCLERNNLVNSETFYDFYASKGWMVGKNKMKDWRASVRTWEKREKDVNGSNNEDNLVKSLKEKYATHNGTT